MHIVRAHRERVYVYRLILNEATYVNGGRESDFSRPALRQKMSFLRRVKVTRARTSMSIYTIEI